MASTKTYNIVVNAQTRNANNALGLLGRNARLAAAAIATVGTALAVREYAQAANAFQNQANKLRIVTDSTKDLMAVQGSLLRLSNESRTSLEATTTLYSRLALFSDGLGLSQQQLLNITGNVSKALVVSGATAQESASVITQLSQAFASGALRGDEFRSINESGSYIMTILAKSMGVTRGELKKLGSEGKITSEVIANALGGSIDELNGKFGEMQLTLPQAQQQLSQSFNFLIGALDESLQISSKVAKGYSFLAGIFESLAMKVDSAYTAGVKQTQGVKDLAAQQKRLDDEFGPLLEKLERDLELSLAVTDADRESIKARHDRIDANKELDKITKGYNLSSERSLELQNQIDAVFRRTNAQLKRRNELEYLSLKVSLQLDNAEQQRMALAVENQKRLDAIDALKIKNKDKELLKEQAAVKLKEEQHQAELRRLQEIVDMERKKRDEAILTEQVRQMNQGKTAEQAKTYAEFENKTSEEKAQFAIGAAKDTFQALGQYNKQAFQAYKAFAIGEAIMNTYMGATKALASYPPPFNFIAAAAVVAGGLAQVAQIRSQQYSGREFGGPVTGGSSYIVGERGPEVFTPTGSGMITPNNALTGKSGQTAITFNINATDADGFDDLLIQRKPLIVGMVQEAMNRQGSSL